MNDKAQAFHDIPDIPGLPLPLSGETRLHVIVGDPITQAGSPRLFNQAFRRRGANAVLVPLHVTPEHLPQALAALRHFCNLDGIVVTVPHKISVMELIDEVQDSGRRIGAVNAIRRLPDGRLVGDNFDGKGCIRGLAQAGHGVRGKSVLIVGGGGAGRAVAHAMADEGPSRLRLFDIDPQRQAELVASLSRAQPGLAVEAGTADPEGFEVVVNCTPLGMRPSDPYPVDPARLSPSALVVDVILKPVVSPLLEAAAQRGCATQPGIRMLEGQVEAICDFFGVGMPA